MTLTRSPERSPASPVQDAEVPFGFDEIFFSRADGRGVIQAGNAVFRRVSGYDWERMIGAPHRIIRHPSMPKGVFQLLWDRLHAGKVTGAFVCNKARDGRPYWVFAVVVPVRDGYISVRIKPGGDLFDVVRSVYPEFLSLEAQGASPSESAAKLLAALAQAGFPSYDSFQARALASVVAHRAGRTARPKPAAEDMAVAAAADGIEMELDAMKGMFDSALLIAMNLRIISSRLGDRGRPVSAISSNYATLAQDMTEWLGSRAVGEDGTGIAGSVSERLFLTHVATLLTEMSTVFGTEGDDGACDVAVERARLAEVAAQYRERAEACHRRALQEAATLETHLSEMRNHVTALNSIRMLCRIEGASLRDTGGSLDQIVSQLDGFQDELGTRLQRTIGLGREFQKVSAQR